MGRNNAPGKRACMRRAPKDRTHLGFCIHYVGTGYRGLQLQTHGGTRHTIEGEFILALRKLGLIEGIERGRIEGDHHHFARSCRTDRGVHAARNLITLFAPNDVVQELGGCEGITEKMNLALPPSIRVGHVTALMGNFIARHSCSRRVYRYMIPAYAVDPKCDTWSTFFKAHPDAVKALAEVTEVLSTFHSKSGAEGADAPTHPVLSENSKDAIKRGRLPYMNLRTTPSEQTDDSAPASDWLSQLADTVQRGSAILAEKFVGSHRFHNFTVDPPMHTGSAASSVSPLSDEALRMIYRCNIAPRVFFLKAADGITLTTHKENVPFLSEEERAAACAAEGPPLPNEIIVSSGAANGETEGATGHVGYLPYIVFQVEGASFLMNMIRKMVGVLIAALRGTRLSLVDELLSADCRATSPMAPGQYLFLALSCYHGYDRTVRIAKTDRFHAIHDEWEGAVSDAAEAFIADTISRDVVDVDLGLLPPLETILAARDARTAADFPGAEEDAHLSSMKEYKPIRVMRNPPKVTEMTSFLRQLRVHNWSVRRVEVPPASKAALEAANAKAKAEEADLAKKRDVECEQEESKNGANAPPLSGEHESASSVSNVKKRPREKEEKEGDNQEGEGLAPASVNPPAEAVSDSKEAMPPVVEDGWIYVGETTAEEDGMRADYFRNRWFRPRRWEYDSPADSAQQEEKQHQQQQQQQSQGRRAPREDLEE